MNEKSKADFEAVLEHILSQSEDDLLRTFEASEGGIYRNAKRSLFGAQSVTLQIPTNANPHWFGVIKFPRIQTAGIECDDLKSNTEEPPYALAA